jgi:hypothetical protein
MAGKKSRNRNRTDKLMAHTTERPRRRLLRRLRDERIVMAFMTAATVALCYACLGSLKG